jgi:hypothetical protein
MRPKHAEKRASDPQLELWLISDHDFFDLDEPVVGS